MANYRYLLDTNIISNLFREPQGNVYQHLQRVGEEAVCTSIVVAAELRFGAKKRNSPVLSAWVEQILTMIDVLPFDVPADHAYAEIRAYLEAAGQIIGPNDLLIAATLSDHILKFPQSFINKVKQILFYFYSIFMSFIQSSKY